MEEHKRWTPPRVMAANAYEVKALHCVLRDANQYCD